MRNLLVKVPRHAQAMVASLVRTIFAQQRPEDAWAQLERVVAQLRTGRFRDAAELLEQAAPDVLAYTGFPRDVWKKAWSNNPQEWLNKETPALDVVGIFRPRRVLRWSGRSGEHLRWPSAAAYGIKPSGQPHPRDEEVPSCRTRRIASTARATRQNLTQLTDATGIGGNKPLCPDPPRCPPPARRDSTELCRLLGWSVSILPVRGASERPDLAKHRRYCALAPPRSGAKQLASATRHCRR